MLGTRWVFIKGWIEWSTGVSRYSPGTSQTLLCLQITWEFRCGVRPEICISNKHPDNAIDVTGLWTSLWVPRITPPNHQQSRPLLALGNIMIPETSMTSETVDFADRMVHMCTVGPNQTPTQAMHLGVNIDKRLGTPNIFHTAALFTVPSKLDTSNNSVLTNVSIHISPLTNTKGEPLILILGRGFLIRGPQEFQMYQFKIAVWTRTLPTEMLLRVGHGSYFLTPFPPGYTHTPHNTNLWKVNNPHPNYLPTSQ